MPAANKPSLYDERWYDCMTTIIYIYQKMRPRSLFGLIYHSSTFSTPAEKNIGENPIQLGALKMHENILENGKLCIYFPLLKDDSHVA